MNNKRNRFALLLSLVVFVCLGSAITYAWFRNTAPKQDASVTTASMSGVLNFGYTNLGIPGEKIVSDTFTLTNTQAKRGFVFELTLNSELIGKDVYIASVELTDETIPVTMYKDEITGKYYGVVQAGMTKTFPELYVEFKGDDIPNTNGIYDIDANDYMGEEFKLTADVKIVQLNENAVSDILFAGNAIPNDLKLLIQ